MTFYIYSPPWFSGIDSLFEIITIIASILISIYSYRTYKFFEIKKYKYFSITFMLLAISFIAKSVSNLIFVVPVKRAITMHFYTIIYTTYQNITIIEEISFALHKLTLILALLILFFIITKEDKIETMLLTCIFALSTSFLIENYLLFNFFVIIISVYLFLNNYVKDRKKRGKKLSNLSYFFMGLSLSYFLLFLAIAYPISYFLGELVLMITFGFILFSFIRIFRK